MGILNVTPDSFSDGGEHFDQAAAIAHGFKMIEEGADIVDVGGESTRPGASPVSAEEEIERVIPVIEALNGQSDAILSIDTMKAEVARRAIAAGASIINDVSALTHDPGMTEVVSSSEVGVVLMHMLGEPRMMQQNPKYEDVVQEVSHYLLLRVRACEDAGVAFERLAVDPGIGFGKLDEHNARLIARLDVLAATGLPVVVGISRKSFVGRTLDRVVTDRLPGSLAAAAYAITRGADIIRVHDVKDSCDMARMTDMLLSENQSDVGIKSHTHTRSERGP